MIRKTCLSRPIRITLAAALLLAAATAYPAAPESLVDFSALPDSGQLFPRLAADSRGFGGHASVPVAGIVGKAGYEHVVLEIRRDDQRQALMTHRLTASATQSTFSFMPAIEAGLFDYRFLVHLEREGRWTTVADRGGIVAGDVYLVQGQSNAVAGDYHFEQLANAELQRPWIRSFGTGSTVPGAVAADLSWYLADGESFNDSGSVGSWALRMAQLLSQSFQVPVAILNGAVGGTAISYHRRDDADPDNLDTNYGRLLYRATAAGVREQARAIIWYQGESDAANTGPWAQDFGGLVSDWRQDYPAIQKVYVFQLRNSCGLATLEMQNLQRLLPDFLPLVTTLSTTAAPGHDFCHFRYEGYRQMGTQLARVMARDLFGGPALPNLDPPNVDYAYFSTPQRDELTLVFRDPDDTLVLESGAEVDFSLSDGTAVVSGQLAGNRLVLQLNSPSQALWVDHTGHAFDGPSLRNALGVGALVFRVPIQAAGPATVGAID